MISGVHVNANTSKVQTLTLDETGDLAAPPGFSALGDRRAIANTVFFK